MPIERVFQAKRQLYRGHRPGYPSREVSPAEVATWIRSCREVATIRTIICLLEQKQLNYYRQINRGLLAAYQRAGITVIHRPVEDYQIPPISRELQETLYCDYLNAAEPILIHCSAGIDRTGAAVDYILECEKGNPLTSA